MSLDVSSFLLQLLSRSIIFDIESTKSRLVFTDGNNPMHKTRGNLNGDPNINDPKGCLLRFLLFAVILTGIIVLTRLFPFAS